MYGALLLIWVGFHFYGVLVNDNGAFLTPRNLWNLSVQMCSIGVMAMGMVLVIVTRNIDLVGRFEAGFCRHGDGCLAGGMVAAADAGLGNPAIWIITVVVGLSLGLLIGMMNGFLIAYLGIPSFIVTLGGLMGWRGAGLSDDRRAHDCAGGCQFRAGGWRPMARSGRPAAGSSG